MHLDDTFVPSLDHKAFTNLEFEGFFAIGTLIENGTILKSSLVENLDGGIVGDLGTIGWRESLNIEAKHLGVKFLWLKRKSTVFVFGERGHTEGIFETTPNFFALVNIAIFVSIVEVVHNLGGSLENVVDI